MSELIVIGYPDRATAEQAYDTVLRLRQDAMIDIDGLALAGVDAEGATHVRTQQCVVGASAASGAVWGLMVGLLFFVPFIGFALGGAAGALIAAAGQAGVDAVFRGRVHDLLTPGAAAVVLLASTRLEDPFAAALRPFGGQVVSATLSEQAEHQLEHELTTLAR